MSSRGKRLRRRNLKISLRALKFPRTSFNVFRYFSRISMMGKIDMTTIWKNYKALPERPGYEARNQVSLVAQFKKNKYDFLYEFNDPHNVNYKVVRMSKKIYVMHLKRGKPFFYKYRNPHLFKYFSKK